MPLSVGDRIVVPATGQTGTLRFVGPTHFRPGTWAGIELDATGTGKNSGAVAGVAYFASAPDSGLFVQLDKVAAAPRQPTTPARATPAGTRGATNPHARASTAPRTPGGPAAHAPTPGARSRQASRDSSARSSTSSVGSASGGSGYASPAARLRAGQQSSSAPASRTPAGARTAPRPGTAAATPQVQRLSRASSSSVPPHQMQQQQQQQHRAPSPSHEAAARRRNKALSINPTSAPAPEPMVHPSKRLTLSVLPSPLPSSDMPYSPGFSPTSSQFSRPSSGLDQQHHQHQHHQQQHSYDPSGYPTPPQLDAAAVAARLGQPPASADAQAIEALRAKVEALEAENRMLQLDKATRDVTGSFASVALGDDLAEKVKDLEDKLAHAELSRQVALAEQEQVSSKQVESMELVLAEMQSTLAEKNATITTQAESLTRMQVELSSRSILASELDDISQTITVLETEAQHKALQAQRLETELTGVRQELRARADQVAQFEKEKRKLEADLDRSRARMQLLERELQQSTNTVDEVMKMGEDRVEIVGKLNLELKARQERISQLSLDLDHRQEILDKTQSLLEDATLRAQANATEAAGLATRIKELERALDEKAAEFAKLVERSMSMQSASEAKDASLQELAALREEFTSLQRSCSALESDKAALAKSRDESVRQAEALRADILRLENALEEATRKLSDEGDRSRAAAVVSRELEAKKTLIAELQSQLEDVTSQLSTLEHNSLSQSQTIKRQQSQVDSHKAAMVELESELEAMTRKCTTAEQRGKLCDQLNARVAELEQELQDARDRSASATSQQVASLQRDLDDAKTASGDLAHRVQTLTDDLMAAKALAAGRTQEMAALEAELNIRQTKLTQLTSDLTEVDTLKATCAELNAKITALETDLEAARTESGDKAREVAALEAKVSALKQSRRETITHYTDSVDSLMKDYAALQAKYDASAKRLSSQSSPDASAGEGGAESAGAGYRHSMPAGTSDFDLAAAGAADGRGRYGTAPQRSSSRVRSSSQARLSLDNGNQRPVTMDSLPSEYLAAFPGVPSAGEQQ